MTDTLEQKLTTEISALKNAGLAIALDFDGVCKLFTEHKHQIMATCLFLNVRQFQRVPFEEYAEAYVHINFRSKDYAGKERFLCACALAEYLHEKGHACALEEAGGVVADLKKNSRKINEANLKQHSHLPQVKSLLDWSREVNDNLMRLTEIGLTPGIKEYLFDAFSGNIDFFVVSTATEDSIRSSMEKENIFFIKRYFGQDTCSKAEALTAMAASGYKHVVMFGDSIEDTRASETAARAAGSDEKIIFAPVIPGMEKECFEKGHAIVKHLVEGNARDALHVSNEMKARFAGREAGKKRSAPLNINS